MRTRTPGIIHLIKKKMFQIPDSSLPRQKGKGKRGRKEPSRKQAAPAVSRGTERADATRLLESVANVRTVSAT